MIPYICFHEEKKDSNIEMRNISNKNNKNALIISFYSPPLQGMGSIRMGKLLKYLPESGWNPFVISGKEKTQDSREPDSLVSDVQNIRLPYSSISIFMKQILFLNGVTITQQTSDTPLDIKRTALKSLSLWRPVYNLPLIRTLVFEPMGWYFKAYREGTKIIDIIQPDVIFSSYAPAVSHLVASRLQKYSKLPWVAEFKDPWSLNQYFSKTQPFQFSEETWEKRVLKNSTLITAISKEVADKMERFHLKDTAVIPDGFDPDDYKDPVPLTIKFTITHTGLMYSGKRNPEPLFSAVRQLFKEGEISPENFEIRFFGSNTREINELVEKYDIGKLVSLQGSVSHRESIRHQKESTILLLLTWNDPREWGYPGKIYEYFGAGRPILASAYRGGHIEDLIMKSGSGIVANEAGEIKDVLLKWLMEFRKYGRITSYFEPNTKVIEDNTWKNQAKKLADVFEIAIKQRK